MKVVVVVPGGFDRSGRERVIPALLWLVERLARRQAGTWCSFRLCPISGSFAKLVGILSV
jgi:hypothetical protein